MRWRTKLITALFLAVAAVGGSVSPCQAQERGDQGAAAAAEAPSAPAGRSPAADPVDPAKMDWILQKWEQQSSLLKTLDVTILRIDDTPAWGDPEFYEGRALFKSPNLAFIDFNKIKQDEKKRPAKDVKGKFLSTPYERIICTGSEVWQYRSDTQQIFIFPLEKDEEKKAIEEGPLPFLFNMRAEDARRRYQMTLLNEDKKNNVYGVSIKPKIKEDQESFSRAFVNLNRDYLLPVRIVLISPDGKSKKDFRLGPMYPNHQVNAKNFEGKALGPPWRVVRNPAGQDRPGIRRARRGDQANPAAARERPEGAARQ
jgi:TIGR03009 family protein